MSRELVQGLAAAGFVALAALLARAARLQLARPLVVAGVRGAVQLTAVGAVVALVFEVPALGVVFAAVMLLSATVACAGRLGADLPGRRRIALAAVALPALAATGLLLACGAFATTPRAAVPAVGILVGGAMVAAGLAGQRLLQALEADRPRIEARLLLGLGVREAAAPTLREAVATALTPALDQTRTAGLVTLPGTFVGLLLGGASPAEAAATQLVVLAALLAVELGAALLVAELVLRARTAPGERLA